MEGECSSFHSTKRGTRGVIVRRGVVTNLGNGIAFVWTSRRDKEILVDDRERRPQDRLKVGDWIEFEGQHCGMITNCHKISAALESRIDEKGRLQVKTEVIFPRKEEGGSSNFIVADSLDFGPVGNFRNFPCVVAGQKYGAWVSRIPFSKEHLGQEYGVQWCLTKQQLEPLPEVCNIQPTVTACNVRQDHSFKDCSSSYKSQSSYLESENQAVLLEAGKSQHIENCDPRLSHHSVGKRSNEERAEYGRHSPRAIFNENTYPADLNSDSLQSRTETNDDLQRTFDVYEQKDLRSESRNCALADQEEGDETVIGIVASLNIGHAFIWTPSLGEGMALDTRGRLNIGDWIKFTPIKESSKQGCKFIVSEFTVIKPLFPTNRVRNTVEVFIEVDVPSDYFLRRVPLYGEFFGKLDDDKRLLERIGSKLAGKRVEAKICRRKPLTKGGIIWSIVHVSTELPPPDPSTKGKFLSIISPSFDADALKRFSQSNEVQEAMCEFEEMNLRRIP